MQLLYFPQLFESFKAKGRLKDQYWEGEAACGFLANQLLSQGLKEDYEECSQD